MSYYIAPQSKNLEVGEMVIYRVVKRLSDFKAEDGKLYRVFKSKKEMQDSNMVTCYRGVNGKLTKSKDEFVLRF
jgi:hypothetical protein